MFLPLELIFLFCIIKEATSIKRFFMLSEFNLLYVEDEEAVSSIIIFTTEEIFNKTYLKKNGEEGLEFYKNNKDKIDLIITDINMPRMNGLDMAKEIKAIDPMIPIIITSAHNDNDYLHKAIEVGVDGYLVKPININKIATVCEKLLSPKILKKELEKKEKENQEILLKNAKFSAVGQLAAGLVHEINTPITYIKGSVEIMNKIMKKLENSAEKEKLEKQSVRIYDGVERLINLVESMKEVTVKSSEEYKETNIFETVVLAATMAYNRSKHIVNIEINKEPFYVNMDKKMFTFNAMVQRQRVEQVWIIIINNALDELLKIEHFEDRKLEVSIEDVEDNIVVQFKDNAGGVKEEMIDKIFEPFESTKESSGIGIGLNIARKIVVEQKGKISVKNENGGAVFKIVLPK